MPQPQRAVASEAMCAERGSGELVAMSGALPCLLSAPSLPSRFSPSLVLSPARLRISARVPVCVCVCVCAVPRRGGCADGVALVGSRGHGLGVSGYLGFIVLVFRG
jgi:hypothetical protein